MTGSLDKREWQRAEEDMPQKQLYDHEHDPQRLGTVEIQGLDVLHYDARREYLEGLNSVVCRDES